ncbi:hypothetical protein [Candidatus Nardonella dryophthoridicola]|uniref:Uncharacterized protein n=1 Tax=endosymbiont of Metamasius hemipterus TaxID=204627 RepID=A0ABT0TWH8_9GAMM|nr:hypothetical protein [Candidatus Nardonella dryophthoridicola]MCM0158347.1 hypothetical protein [endosymbiont of Metamasius hemipterus]
MRKFHADSPSTSQTNIDQHIICPLCSVVEKFFYYDELNNHLTITHNIPIKKSVLNFRSFEEFAAWRGQEKRELDYVCQKKKETD